LLTFYVKLFNIKSIAMDNIGDVQKVRRMILKDTMNFIDIV